METILRSITGYIFLVIMVRVLARRPGAQMALFEFVIVFLIGGVAIAATTFGDRSVTNCTCAAITVGLMHRSFSYLKRRSPRFGAIIDGAPVVIVRNRRFEVASMTSARVIEEDLHAAARGKGITNLSEIDYAILERNGSISIMRNKDNS